jgi:DNA modification methylase
METNKIYNEDCFVTMANMPQIVDVVLTSPPYNTARTDTTQKALDTYNNRYDVYLDDKTDDEYLDWSVELFNLYDKVLKQNGCVLYNLSYSAENTDLIWKIIGSIITKTNFTTADTIIWKKNCALPNNTSANKLTRICEFVFVFARKNEASTFYMNKKIVGENDRGQKYYENIFNFIEAPNNDASNDLNKATFSTKFVRSLLNLYAKPNSLIYDSFMGTGTTADACIIEKMNFIGSELSPAQCEYAQKRIDFRISQPTLF